MFNIKANGRIHVYGINYESSIVKYISKINMLEFKIVKTLAVYNSYLFQCLSCTFLMAKLLNVILSFFFFFNTVQIFTKTAANEPGPDLKCCICTHYLAL